MALGREAEYRLEDDDLIGLDERPRPRSTRARIVQGLAQSAPFSSLQRRIIAFNLLGLAMLVAGVLYLNQFRSGLIEQRVQGLRTIAEMIAVTVAQDPVGPKDAGDYDADWANRVLARLVAPTGLRARLYDTSLTLTGDTRRLLAQPEPPAGAAPATREEGVVEAFVHWLEQYYGAGVPSDGSARPGGAQLAYQVDLEAALAGLPVQSVRRNDRDQLVVAVAQPVTEAGRPLGVLLLTTEGEDINEIVRAERAAIIQVFLIAAIVSVALSVLLANTIATPIKRLAAAASVGGSANPARPLGPDRVQIPDLKGRSDEIGELSAALIRMTDALYARIDAIESFASDVAHEIKNPLTSLRSAVETMQYAKTPEQRQRLLEVINHDVRRMDRLVTDISNASRLDAELVRERMEPFDLGRLLSSLAAAFADQAGRRGVEVELDLLQEPLTARGLEGRIAQVVTNFLDNALSFSPEGGRILLRARRHDGAIRVSVLDDGPGVPPDNLASVFERFYTERPEEQGFGNHSGLGLAISRQIVEAHGGRIWVENRPGAEGAGSPPAGAEFVFELPE